MSEMIWSQRAALLVVVVMVRPSQEGLTPH